jgi:hypothetical protein
MCALGVVTAAGAQRAVDLAVAVGQAAGAGGGSGGELQGLPEDMVVVHLFLVAGDGNRFSAFSQLCD